MWVVNLPNAFCFLKKNCCGFIHCHDICSSEKIPKKPLKIIEITANDLDRKVELISFRVIKSYSPGIDHIVLDVRVVK